MLDRTQQRSWLWSLSWWEAFYYRFNLLIVPFVYSGFLFMIPLCYLRLGEGWWGKSAWLTLLNPRFSVHTYPRARIVELFLPSIGFHCSKLDQQKNARRIFILLCFFETGSCCLVYPWSRCIIHVVLLPQHPEYYDYRCVPLHQAHTNIVYKSKT
jgi:hypothetical protein